MGICEIHRNEMYVYFYLERGEEAQLLGIFKEKNSGIKKAEQGTCRIVDLICPDRKNYSFRGGKTFYDMPAYLFYMDFCTWTSDSRFEIVQYSEDRTLKVTTCYEFAENADVFSCKSILENLGDEEITIEGITSFCFGAAAGYEKGKSGPSEDVEIYYAHNTWSEECRWVHKKLKDVGIWAYGNLCYDRFRIANHSGFSTGEYLPMGALYNKQTDTSVLWQIESSTSWAYEVGCFTPEYRESFLKTDYRQQIYLQLFGPDMESAGWYRRLKKGERFETVETAVACGMGRPESVMKEMTVYRRQKRKIMELPIIFNDYMNCLMGDSTTEKLLPLIDRAAEAGCEIFVVDCGWYDIGEWQYTFGEFEECRQRYPGGLSEVMDYIRRKGMKPGIWLELESVGLDCAGLQNMPKEWFFQRHEKPVIDSGRVHLDFRVKEVRERASAILKRVISRYHLGYIKIDYNLELSYGTEFQADSPADGMLQHNRAYLAWLEEEHAKYPEVVFENCGSGGLRMDYGMLSRMDIQSVSDQEDYRIMAVIAANSASAVLPEQAGIWTYPLKDADRESCIMNMASAMLQRIHLGGNLDQLTEEGFALVKEGIQCYKEIRKEIPDGIPFWPLGFHSFDAGWLVFGLHLENRDLIMVCRREDEKKRIHFPVQKGVETVNVLYPAAEKRIAQKDGIENDIVVELERENSAVILEIIYE